MTTSKGKKAAPSVPQKPHLLNWLKDAGNAAAYIDAALEEGDEAGLMQALRNVAEARGGIASVAEKTGLNRETLYRTLSKRGNPKLKSLASILEATGIAVDRDGGAGRDEKGGVAEIARRSHLSREETYRLLSAEGNPELRCFTVLLNVAGLRLSIKPVEHRGKKAA